VNDGGHLVEAWTRGAPVTDGRRLVAESVLLQVAVARESLLLVGPLPSELTGDLTGAARVASVAVIPLVRGESVLGVLTVAALPGQRYTTDDLDVLTRLAAPAAQAIANARRYEAARLQDFDGIDTRREELREIGRSIRDAVTLTRRGDLEPCERSDLLDRIDHHAVRLLEEVD
jgi:GAF domain-containing protein